MLHGICTNCGNDILVMCFMGEDWCSEMCRKTLAREDTPSDPGPAALSSIEG